MEQSKIKVIKSSDRYKTALDWLTSYHSFSFGEHFHPENRGWGSLRVINEDYIKNSQGFGMHPHRDMEIVTYMIKGELEHRDSFGNHGIIKEDEVQRISAGSGIEHSEFNPSQGTETHLLQIWFLPHTKQTRPEYLSKRFLEKDKINKLLLIVSEQGREGSIPIKQDLDMYASKIDQNIDLKISKEKGWIQVIEGELETGSYHLSAGDALALEGQTSITLKPLNSAHFLFFDIN